MKVLIDIDEALYNYILDGTLNEVNHAVKNGVILDKATNGDVIKAMFPSEVWLQMKAREFNKTWWNAPYKGKSEDKENV